MGANFVAQPLGQALLTMDVSDAALRLTNGDAVDLLLWIPKKGVPVCPGDMRPWQLPPCFRRLVGAALAEVVGPLVEPRLSPQRAAIRGGHCGPNVAAAFRHLARDRDDAGERSAEKWNGLLGTASPALLVYAVL